MEDQVSREIFKFLSLAPFNPSSDFKLRNICTRLTSLSSFLSSRELLFSTFYSHVCTRDTHASLEQFTRPWWLAVTFHYTGGDALNSLIKCKYRIQDKFVNGRAIFKRTVSRLNLIYTRTKPINCMGEQPCIPTVSRMGQITNQDVGFINERLHHSSPELRPPRFRTRAYDIYMCVLCVYKIDYKTICTYKRRGSRNFISMNE